MLRADADRDKASLHLGRCLSARCPPPTPIGRDGFTHVVGVGLRADRGVLALPFREIINEPLDLYDRAIKAPEMDVAGVADAPATEIGSMVVVLFEKVRPETQRAHLALGRIVSRHNFVS